jgi:hypothetical protein
LCSKFCLYFLINFCLIILTKIIFSKLLWKLFGRNVLTNIIL